MFTNQRQRALFDNWQKEARSLLALSNGLAYLTWREERQEGILEITVYAYRCILAKWARNANVRCTSVDRLHSTDRISSARKRTFSPRGTGCSKLKSSSSRSNAFLHKQASSYKLTNPQMLSCCHGCSYV